MGLNEEVTLLLKEVRGQLAHIEELLDRVPVPCDGRKGELKCSLMEHNGWHLATDGKTQWLDD
jgi:hypothetical protein